MLRVALDLLGARTDAVALSGLSGAAFRTYWRCAADEPGSPPIWDADVPGVCAIDPLAAAAEAFAWRLLWYRNAPGHVAFQFAMQAIDRAQPVLSYGFAGEPEDVLIVGCDRRDESRDLLVLTRHAPEPLFFALADGPWPGTDDRGICVGLFDRVPPRLRRPLEASIHRAFRRAIWLARTPRLRARGTYRSGLAAYDAWIDTLIRPGEARGARAVAERIVAAYALPSPGVGAEWETIGIRHVLHRALTALAEARREGADFLRLHANLYPTGEAPACIDREAAALDEAASLWPAVVEGDARGFRFASVPEGLEACLRREETARCLRLAAADHARAVMELEARVPPTEQELAEGGED